jgi:hypothetical protein
MYSPNPGQLNKASKRVSDQGKFKLGLPFGGHKGPQFDLFITSRVWNIKLEYICSALVEPPHWCFPLLGKAKGKPLELAVSSKI